LSRSKSTWIGLIIGVGCIAISIMASGDIRTFLNLPSFCITIGGTVGAVVLSFPVDRLKTLRPVMKKAFINEKFDVEKDIDTIVSLAEITRKEGFLALEDTVDEITDDKFLKEGIMLIIDGADKDQLMESLQTEIYFMKQRHKKGWEMLDMIGSEVTSLGLVGTYVGLIPMLINLEDPTKLGPLMAIELVTSFYGAFLAYVIFLPMSKRLKVMNANEVTRKELFIEGLMAIEESQNPKVIRERLTFYMMSKGGKDLRSQQEDKFKIKEVA
jgi:chemotaxis protein MotA